MTLALNRGTRRTRHRWGAFSAPGLLPCLRAVPLLPPFCFLGPPCRYLQTVLVTGAIHLQRDALGVEVVQVHLGVDAAELHVVRGRAAGRRCGPQAEAPARAAWPGGSACRRAWRLPRRPSKRASQTRTGSAPASWAGAAGPACPPRSPASETRRQRRGQRSAPPCAAALQSRGERAGTP